MLEIIIKLLIALGLYANGGPTKNIVVIDQSSGSTYNINVTTGITNSITNGSTTPEVYYLVRNADGTYSLVRR
jgi:hypothetical protein